MTLVSYAQNYEDVLLWRCLRDVPGGFYIDVGAWEPDRDSVTRLFSDLGWRGVNVEPTPDAFARLQQRRPRDINLAVLVGAAPGVATLFGIADTGLSTTDTAFAQKHRTDGYATVPRSFPVVTLAEICRQHAPAQIHFLKIDCEGDEAAVLAGADFHTYRPWIVLLEAVLPNSQEPNYAHWEPTLLAAGYRFAWFDGLNRFYVAEEHAARLVPKLQLPPNVFDDFVRATDPVAPTPLPATGDQLLDPPAHAQQAAHSAQTLAETVVSDVFQALLFRGVDAAGLAVFANSIRDTGSTAALLQAVLHSPEFQTRRPQFGAAYLGEPTAPSALATTAAGPFACRMLEVVLEREGPLGRAGDVLILPNDQVMLPAVLAAGSWHSPQVDFVARHADPQRHYLVLDIGANVGLFSRALLRRCGTIAACRCVEPDETNLSALRRNVAAFPAATVHNVALGAVDGTATLFRDAENSGNSSLHADAMRDRPLGQAQVRVAAAGPWLQDNANGDLPILWKSDTQGSDERIVAAAPWPVWRRVAAAVIVLWRIDKDQPAPEAFFERIADMPHRRLGTQKATVADIRAYLDGRDWAHQDLYLWR